MDLSTVETLRPARSRADLALAPGEAVLAGGSWLFSTPQPHLTGLVDLTTLGWPALEARPDGALRIAATCTVADLVAADPHPLVRPCAEALLLSAKIWPVATVGGNLCLALPAGALIALLAVLDGVVVVWTVDGGERREAVADFVLGVGRTSLTSGEVVRAVEVPATSPTDRTAHRRIALTRHGRTGALVVGRGDADGSGRIVVTGATTRPVTVALDGDLDELLARIDALGLWYADPHGPADWRRAMTARLIEQVRGELSGLSGLSG